MTQHTNARLITVRPRSDCDWDMDWELGSKYVCCSPGRRGRAGSHRNPEGLARKNSIFMEHTHYPTKQSSLKTNARSKNNKLDTTHGRLLGSKRVLAPTTHHTSPTPLYLHSTTPYPPPPSDPSHPPPHPHTHTTPYIPSPAPTCSACPVLHPFSGFTAAHSAACWAGRPRQARQARAP